MTVPAGLGGSVCYGLLELTPAVRSMPEERDLKQDELEEVAAAMLSGAHALGISAGDAPKAVVTAINTLLGDHLDGTSTRPSDDMIIDLAVLLATQYSRAFKWSWAMVTWENGYEAYSMVSPDKSLAFTPIPWVKEIVDGEKAPNVLLHFNMIEAGKLPPASPGDYCLLQ